MTSDLAAGDLEDLRAEGLAPTDDDIVRLHALALRISDGPETTAYNAPRWGIAGGVVFWEPTMAARMWFAFAKSFASDADTEDWMFAFACAKGREPKFLERLRNPAEIEHELGLFMASVTATKPEVDRAVYYAAIGTERVEAEMTELEKANAKPTAPDERERRNLANMEEILANAAAATGLTMDDLLAQTDSRLLGMIYAAHVQAGMGMKPDAARAHARYLATLGAIAKRLRAEKRARDAAGEGKGERGNGE